MKTMTDISEKLSTPPRWTDICTKPSGFLENVLTFVVPLRHPQNSPNWPAPKQRLAETIRSIAGQDDVRWRTISVANGGSDLPALPSSFELKQVDDLEAFRNSFRLDKGRRVLAGILQADRTGYVMVVDDDDFVNCRLTSFVAGHLGENGWYVLDGYIWGDGGKLICKCADFSKVCGTSHIIRADLFKLPASAEAEPH